MATTESTLESTNFLQPTGFKVIINRKRFKNLEFFAQTVQHPSVSAGPAIAPFRGTNLALPGDKLEYSSLSMEAILDENMNVYKEMLEWLKFVVLENNKPRSLQTTASEDLTSYDIKLAILSSHNNTIDTITYKDSFPIDLGTINFQSNVDGINYITVPITFAYSSFDVTA